MGWTIIVSGLFLIFAIVNLAQGVYYDAVLGIGVSSILFGLFLFNRFQEKRIETFLIWLDQNKDELINDKFRPIMWNGVPVTHDSFVTQYQFCTSFFILSVRQPTAFILDQSSSKLSVNIISTIVTLIFGWWGFPWGPIYSVQTIFQNLRGGIKKSIEELIIESENAEEGAAAHAISYCISCGNEVEETARFCTTCGSVVATNPSPISDPPLHPPQIAGVQSPPQTASSSPISQPVPLPFQAAQGGRDFAIKWGLVFLAAGLLMGLIALLIGWTQVNGESMNGVDWIKNSDWFVDTGEGVPWWLGILALLPFLGLALVGFTLLGKVVRESPVPHVAGIGAFGALMLALCPMFTHLGFWLWFGNLVGESEHVWDYMWRSDGPGIWLALAAGIIALIGTAAVSKREARSL